MCEKNQEYATKDGKETILYKVYLETNKLPTQIKVPTGKYVSGNADKELLKTSAENLKLKLSVYFYSTTGCNISKNVKSITFERIKLYIFECFASKFFTASA